MSSAQPELSKVDAEAELARLKRRRRIILSSFVAIFAFALVINPLIPYGPLLVPVLSIYAGDLPAIALIPILAYLVLLSFRASRRESRLRIALRKLRRPNDTPASGASLPADEPTDQGAVEWFPNRRWNRFLVLAKIGAIGLGSDVALVVITLLFAPATWDGPWGNSLFSLGFTGGLGFAVVLGIGGVAYRQEPRQVGVSPQGFHRPIVRPPSEGELPTYIPWAEVTSASDLGGGSTTYRDVALKLVDGRRLAVSTDVRGVETILRAYEVSRPAVPTAGGAPREGTSTERGIPRPASFPARPSDSVVLPGVPETSWEKNSMRRQWLQLGFLLFALGIVLVVVLWPYSRNPRTSQAFTYGVLPIFVGILFIWGALKLPDSVAITSWGFQVRTGQRTDGLPWRDITEISIPGSPLDCGVTSGRTRRFQALGSREKERILQAYRFYRDAPTASAVKRASAPVTWTKNAVRFAVTARFYVPLGIPVVAVAIIVPLYFWDPAEYLGALIAIPLAFMAAPLATFTLRAYRRAPSEVGISQEGLVVHYPHALYPAEALTQLRWNEVAKVRGPRGEPGMLSTDPTGFTPSAERNLTFRTSSGILYTLGPVSPSIELEIVRHSPSAALEGNDRIDVPGM